MNDEEPPPVYHNFVLRVLIIFIVIYNSDGLCRKLSRSINLTENQKRKRNGVVLERKNDS